MSEMLFIGGSHDGERINIDDRFHNIRLPVYPPKRYDSIIFTPPLESFIPKEELYEKKRLRDHDSDYEVFLIKGEENLIERLIAGYRHSEAWKG